MHLPPTLLALLYLPTTLLALTVAGPSLLHPDGIDSIASLPSSNAFSLTHHIHIHARSPSPIEPRRPPASTTSSRPHPLPLPGDQAGRFAGVNTDGEISATHAGKQEKTTTIAAKDGPGFTMNPDGAADKGAEEGRTRGIARRRREGRGGTRSEGGNEGDEAGLPWTGDLERHRADLARIRRGGRGSEGGSEGDEAGPSNVVPRKKGSRFPYGAGFSNPWPKKKFPFFKKKEPQIPYDLEPVLIPIPIPHTYGDPPRSRWRPRKPPKRPKTVPEKNSPGRAYRLQDGVDPRREPDQNGGDSDSSSSLSPSPYRKPGQKQVLRLRQRKPKEWRPFSGSGSRLDAIPVGKAGSEMSAAAPRAARERWTPPTTTPSLRPPKRIFPFGLGSRIKKLLPGRRNRKERLDAAEPSPPLDPRPISNEDPGAAEPSPPPEAIEGGRKPARNTLFPGTGRKLDEGSPPASPAASRQSESDRIYFPSPRSQRAALREDLRRFPGVPQRLREPEGESEETRLASVDWYLFRQELARWDSDVSSRPSTDDSHYGRGEGWQVWGEKKAVEKKWPGKAYRIQDPLPPPPGLGFAESRPNDQPNDARRLSPEASNLDSEGGHSDASRRSGKKFPGMGHRLNNAGEDPTERGLGDATG